MRNIKIIIFFLSSICFLFSCDLDRVNLDEVFLPNYSITLGSLQVAENTISDIIVLSDTEYLMAVERNSSQIDLIKFTQISVDDTWDIETENLLNIGEGSIRFFDSIPSGFLIGFQDVNNEFTIIKINSNFEIENTASSFESFVDTFYNSSEGLDFYNFSVTDQGYHLAGRVSSQGTNFSCLLNVNLELEPQWFKTYFEKGVIQDVSSIGIDSFYLVHNSPVGADLILDNIDGTAYKKFDLSINELFFGGESIVSNDKLFLSGIDDNVARTIEINIDNQSAFINEIEIYPVNDFRAIFITRDNILGAGIQPENTDNYLFTSELGPIGSIWCNRYIDSKFQRIIDLEELPERGIVVASTIENENNYFINITRVDEEGATINNQFSENCL